MVDHRSIDRYHRFLLLLSHTWLWKRMLVWRSHLAVIVLAVLALAFGAISFLIHQPKTQRVDYRVTHWMQAHRTPWLDFSARDFTFLGATATLCVFGVVCCLALLILRNPRAAVLSVVSLVGLPLNYAIKGVFHRPRPDASLVEVLGPTFGLSYPSGHAMASFMFYGFLAMLAWIHAPTPRLRYLGVAGFGATAISISASRIYLGAHWLSDVLGGMTAGLFCLTVFAILYRRWTAKGTVPPTGSVRPERPTAPHR